MERATFLGRGGAAGLASAAMLLGACAETGTTVLPPYQLANGRMLQDVVSVASDPSGGAPVITSLTTFDVGASEGVRVIARDTASSPGVGQSLAKGLGSAAISTAAIVVAAEVANNNDDRGTTVNASYATSGNTATGGGDAGDIDALTVGCTGRNPNCTPSN
ncbi:hypothetical protein OCGS_2611 [Oceaniovalibus guishaninsula JLT2003]|uniref:Lipoprotein n=1 Tax=Oceaniovalibus guishaninsula JLT2003 TaxID=1231392 RepID=K2HJV1_9RHOB|nr:hypothetical protein [Oceaniovalibus guishaninsula]EKE43274.1 hypothetical protein OCGS_2611 [Oceaniovalibus guishaninsula JLT2003]